MIQFFRKGRYHSNQMYNRTSEILLQEKWIFPSLNQIKTSQINILMRNEDNKKNVKHSMSVYSIIEQARSILLSPFQKIVYCSIAYRVIQLLLSSPSQFPLLYILARLPPQSHYNNNNNNSLLGQEKATEGFDDADEGTYKPAFKQTLPNSTSCSQVFSASNQVFSST